MPLPAATVSGGPSVAGALLVLLALVAIAAALAYAVHRRLEGIYQNEDVSRFIL